LVVGSEVCSRLEFFALMVMCRKAGDPVQSAKKRDQWVQGWLTREKARPHKAYPLRSTPCPGPLLNSTPCCWPHTAAPRTHARLVLTLEKVPMSSPLFLIKGHRHMGIHTVPLNTHLLPKADPVALPTPQHDFYRRTAAAGRTTSTPSVRGRSPYGAPGQKRPSSAGRQSRPRRPSGPTQPEPR
jgi:hypothetical protein